LNKLARYKRSSLFDLFVSDEGKKVLLPWLQYAHLIHIGGRVYDPLLGQWMTPAWDKVFDAQSKSPFDIFSYRFYNNDPVNPERNFFHMTSKFISTFMIQFRLIADIRSR
jgi:hypothetical protein